MVRNAADQVNEERAQRETRELRCSRKGILIVLMLRDGWPFEEIARNLGMTVNAVRLRAVRIRNAGPPPQLMELTLPDPDELRDQNMSYEAWLLGVILQRSETRGSGEPGPTARLMTTATVRQALQDPKREWLFPYGAPPDL